MRHSAQLALTAPWIGHVHAMELAAISALLDEEAGFAALVQQDLEAACRKNPGTGRPGLTGEQVLRMAVARQLNDWTYAELAFHLADSVSYRTFCRVETLKAPPSKSAVAANIRAVRPRTLAALNDLLVTGAAARAVEAGRRQIVLAPAMVRLLRARWLASSYKGPDDFIFTTSTGRGLNYRKVGEAFRLAVCRTGIREDGDSRFTACATGSPRC